MASEVIDTDRGFDELVKQLADLSKDDLSVEVGIFEEAGPEIVTRAAANEFGTATIPERSFMRSTIDEGKSKIADDLSNATENILRGEPAKSAMDGVGRRWAEEIKKTIRDMSQPPNAPSTIAKKGRDDPLVDSTDMMNAVTHKVKGG